jgi:hypothetical protein
VSLHLFLKNITQILLHKQAWLSYGQELEGRVEKNCRFMLPLQINKTSLIELLQSSLQFHYIFMTKLQFDKTITKRSEISRAFQQYADQNNTINIELKMLKNRHCTLVQSLSEKNCERDKSS